MTLKGTAYNVKMHAERACRHTSGAERIVSRDKVQEALRTLLERAMNHPNGEPDSIVLTVNALADEIARIPALPVSECETHSPDEARRVLEAELERLGCDARRILDLFYSLRDMRGAALVQQHTLARMEPDPQRGVRATVLDYSGNRGSAKNHFKEALCLASKVAACPFIAAELCISDDPDYTTGYFASKERGYVRLPEIKEKGDPRGGRIFLFTGSEDDVRSCMRYLEETPVLVDME